VTCSRSNFSVNKVTVYELDDQDLISERNREHTLHCQPRMALVPTLPPMQWILEASFIPGNKSQLRHKTDHLPSSHAKTENAWGFNFMSPIHLYGVVLGHWGNLYFYHYNVYKCIRFCNLPTSWKHKTDHLPSSHAKIQNV